MSVFGDRLRQLREEKGLKTEELASRLGIGRTTLTNYETGTRRPKQETMDAILDFFNVDLAWLDGKTEVRNVYNFSGIYDAGYKAGLKEATVSSEELAFLKKYRGLSRLHKEAVTMMVDKLSEKTIDDEMEASPMQFRTMMFYGSRPSAGYGNWLPDQASMGTSQIQVPDNPKTKKADFVLEVDGASMEPKLFDGDRILVKHQDAVDPGEIGVFMVNGQAVVKQCQNGYLHSLNPEYEDIQLKEGDKVVCFGKVIGKL